MSDVEVKNIDEIKKEKPLIIFGKDVREITCFKTSFIYGIFFGFAGGFATFLCTSKTALSTSVGFGSLWLGVFGYWIPCRYKYETTVLTMAAIQKSQIQMATKTESDKENS